MKIKKFLSVILCLAFVVSLFPSSTVAQSDHFIAEDNGQKISVSEAVYAEQGNDIDKGIGDNISLDDLDVKGKNEMPAANMKQMMTLEGDGDEDNPIKGLSDLKTSHKFPEETGVYHVRIPKEGEENEDSYVYC
ncbi:MAG: hypothetical protein ACOYJ1_16330, partial [Peptococcales bacterium]